MDLRRLLNWKAAGLAGLVGVVATGVVLARDERERRSYTADEVRDRLHERADAAAARSGATTTRREKRR